MSSLSPDLNHIAKLFDRSRPRVVIVVGAGVGISGTSQPQASWLGLLKHGIQHLVATDRFTKRYGDELESSLNRAFSPFQLKDALNHAGIVEQTLNTPGEEAFAEWLQSAFADFKVQDNEKAQALLQGLRDLHEAGALLLTTNYDSLLTQITNAPAVTWDQHDDFHRVMTRQKTGILHIHGHWQRPSSIVLGNRSYDRVVSDVAFQQLLRTLWLDWSWIYVGCGNGLDDPNLGRLIEWSKEWGNSALPDFFLAREDEANKIAARPNKPTNLISIGYKSHSDLATVLQSITPAARCWPFVRIDDDFPFFHVPGAKDPFPTHEEYLNGEVPTLAVDAELQQRLQEHGWACCIDVASVGKTTLALRAATTPAQRAHPVFYLDLKKIFPDDIDSSPIAAAHRLARPGTLLILDNIHHQPELSREIWQLVTAQPSDRRGRLLLVGTRIHQPIVVTPEQDLMFFERHSLNPAILVQPTPADLGRIAKHLYHRVGGAKCPPMPDPSAEALAEWYRNYGAALNAFTFAVLDSLADLQKGEWQLPLSRASEWVRKHWLNKLNAHELENTICLAAFGAQELEILIQNEALPHPGETKRLFELGLVAQTELGQLKQYRQLELREPGWGRLILAALSPPVDEEQTLFATASRHLVTLIYLSSRLQRDGNADRLKRLWKYIAPRADGLLTQIFDLPLPYIPQIAWWAKAGEQPELITKFFKVVEENPQVFATRARQTSLEAIGSFFQGASRHGCDTAVLWDAFVGTINDEDHEFKMAQFVKATWARPLNGVKLFFDVAKRHKRNTASLWDALIGKPGELNRQAKLAEFVKAAWTTSLDHIAAFLEIAKRHERDTASLWDALIGKPGDPDREVKLVEFIKVAWATSLDKLSSFLEVAKRHGRDTASLWDALIGKPGDPDREVKLAEFVKVAWATSLDKVGSFFEQADRDERDTASLWDALLGKQEDPDQEKLAVFVNAACATTLDCIGSFLDVAKRQERDPTPLWDALIGKPEEQEQKIEWFVNAARKDSLSSVGSFLDVAQRHDRDITLLWDALLGPTDDPDQDSKLTVFVNAALTHSLEKVGSFIDVAKRHGRDTFPLWDALVGKPGDPNQEAKLAEFVKAAETYSMEKTGYFLDVAKRQGVDTTPLWDALLGKPGESEKSKVAQFVNAALNTPLDCLTSFLDVAKSHERDTTELWEELESQPANLAASAWLARLDCIGSFLNCARQHGRNSEQLEQTLASEPDKLAAKGKEAEVNDLVGFAHYVRGELFEIAVSEIKPGHWDALSTVDGMTGASWLVSKFTEVNRGDLAADLATLLLRRANWRDFRPRQGGFNQVCWFLASIPISAIGFVEPFCKAICTEKWLRVVYAATPCGQIASGLRKLALHQSVERCRQFHYKGLGGRLNKELARFETAEPKDQSQIIQLLGSVGLCGWAVGRRNLIGISHDTLSQLPLSVLPHRPEATKIENYQFQLWLGLRNFVSIKRERLPLPLQTIEETLTLWRANLEETSQTPAIAAHLVNLSMVQWLEDCCHAIPSALLPNAEPLWTLAGFPLFLNLSNRSSQSDWFATRWSVAKDPL